MKPIGTVLFQVLALGTAAPMLHCGATVSGPMDAESTSPDGPDTLDGGADVTTPIVDAPMCDAPAVTRTVCVDTTVLFSCGLPSSLHPGTYAGMACATFCGPYVDASQVFPFECEVTAASPGAPARLVCREGCAVDGRRPEGFTLPPPRPGATALQQYLADSAALECASIAAFERLAMELHAHGANPSLVARALASADDERRHTRMMTALAARHGVVTRPETPPTGAVRDLPAIALENAVEGCVRETYGAVLAWWQAEHAGDREVAAVYRAIAEDETRHAELAWDVAEWIEPLLDAAVRARVRTARDAAVVTLAHEMTAVPAELCQCAGVPTAADASRLITGLDDRLWTAAA